MSDTTQRPQEAAPTSAPARTAVPTQAARDAAREATARPAVPPAADQSHRTQTAGQRFSQAATL